MSTLTPKFFSEYQVPHDSFDFGTNGLPTKMSSMILKRLFLVPGKPGSTFCFSFDTDSRFPFFNC